MKAKTMRPAAKRTVAVLMAALLAIAGLVGPLMARAERAYAAEASIYVSDEHLDFRQYDSNTGNSWADTFMYIDGEVAMCIDVQTTVVDGAWYWSQGMDAGMALRLGLYDRYLWEAHPGWGAATHYGYLQYMVWCEYNAGYMDAYVSPERSDFWDVYAGAKAYYEQNKDSYEAWGTEWHSSDSQSVCVIPRLTPKGTIEVHKSSAIAKTTDGNACYSLAGAVYTVYSDEGCTATVGPIETDAAGNGKLEHVTSGTYWVKETQASPGYSLDPNSYKVEVEAGETVSANGKSGLPEIPQSDPVGMLVGKVDATTNANRPEGAATLEGAQFTVRYYDGYYGSAEAAEASGDATRTWVFKTDADGFAYYSDEYKASGDALYHQSNGDASIPLGTVVIEETRAPQGYNLDDGTGGAPKRFCVQITSEGAVGESVYTYNSPTQPDTVKRGDFRLVKEVPVAVYDDDGNPQEVERILAEGVQFQLINDNEGAVVSPETGEEVVKGGVVCTITVDENGLATTRAIALPDGWTGALAYGSYTVHEIVPEDVAAAFKAEHGKELLAVPDWKTTISGEGQYDAPALVNDHIPQTPLKVVKVDAETGKQVPLQCSFQLLDASGHPVTFVSHYPEESVMDTWTTNGNGEVTLPMLLEEGSYTITEVQAPYGCAINLEGVGFEVGAEYNGWDDPVTVEFADMPQKGIIKIVKHDATTDEPVDGSTYIVKAAADIVTPEGTVRASADDIVATLVTDENGEAETEPLYLGTYTVYEAKAKDGFALNVDEVTVELSYQGQEIEVFEHEEPVADTPTEIKLHKVDATDPETPVAGATFRVWNDEGTFDEELASDEEGNISVKYIKHGSYHVQETAAPDGYVVYDVDEEGAPAVHDFTVNDQGMIEFDGYDGMTDVFAWTVENMPKSMRTTAIDKSSGTHEGQARGQMAIIDTIEYTGCIPGEEYTVSGTLMDKETGEAALDASGKEITASATFTAEGFTGTVEIEFTFDGVELAGHDVVAFEAMEHEGKEYMVHADIEDEGQTVRVVDIHTTATNPETGDNLGSASEELELVDVVAYENLTPGSPYRLTATLYDSETGSEIVDSEGKVVTAEVEFTPEEENGIAEVHVTVATEGIAGHTLVFFERLADAEGNTIATHTDSEDEGQSIHFADIRTTAVDGDDGDRNVVADEKAKVVDAVSYENLIPGKEYVLEGRLVDKSTGETLKDAAGKEITASTTFTPDKPEGSVDVTFEFDGSKLAGKTAVAFETLSRDGIEIAVHADVEDEAQTVELVTPEKDTPGKGYPKTGGSVPVAPIAASIVVIAGCGAAGAAYALGKRRKIRNAETSGAADSEE